MVTDIGRFVDFVTRKGQEVWTTINDSFPVAFLAVKRTVARVIAGTFELFTQQVAIFEVLAKIAFIAVFC